LKRILLVDGHYYAYRSFYAIRHLTNSRGEATNALYGMAKALNRMVADLKPDYAVVIMDGGLPAHRMEQHADYKANRAETPADLSAQFPAIEELAPALGFAYLRVEGEEADDILACYAQEAERRGIEAILATNDKDLFQLVSGSVRIYQPGPDSFALLDPAAVEAKWGVPPAQIGDILTLTGDAVDNIPGVPGVGPKTAAGWIREFGSVENLLANIPKLKSEKQRAALEASRDLIARNRILVALRCDLPLPQPLEEMPLRPDLAQQAALFARLEFKGLLASARAALGTQAPLPPPPAPHSQGELF
jgi:DNA polymerase-1